VTGSLPAPPLASPAARPASLHLIDQVSPQATPATLILIARLQQPVLLLGGTPLQRVAEAAGLGHATRVGVPTGHAMWGLPALAKALREQSQPRDLHVWSISCLAALRWVGGPAQHTLHLVIPPNAADLRRLRRLDHPALRIVVHGQTLRDDLIAAGFAASRLRAQALPGLDATRAQLTGDRDALRTGWKLPGDGLVVALLSDPPAEADTNGATMAINLAAEAAGRDMRLLVHPHQTQRPRIQVVLDDYGHGNRMIQDAALATPWRVLCGCDAAMLGETPAPLSARYAAAAGLPIVAPDTPMHREALAGAKRVHWAVSAEPKRLADRLQHRALKLSTVPMPPVVMPA